MNDGRRFALYSSDSIKELRELRACVEYESVKSTGEPCFAALVIRRVFVFTRAVGSALP